MSLLLFGTHSTTPAITIADTVVVSDALDRTPAAPAQPLTPSPLYDVAFASQPLTVSPNWVDVSTRLRGFSSKRGRSYEFERMETGTSAGVLSNRDAALSPANSSSPYATLRSTRPVRIRLEWAGTVYPAFRGISEGFPQTYPSLGQDALVELRANDPFYALNQARFSPGSTTLTASLAVVAQNTEETISVASTALPLPQAVPFTITVAGLTSEWPTEDMEVQEILSATSYRVIRSQETTWEHPVGAALTTAVVSFAEELSGERIRHVLEAVGFDSGWYDLDAGQTLIAASTDLASVNPLEHISLVSEAEFGRFFVSRAGLFTFRDRQSGYVDNLTPALTFTGGQLTPAASDVPYRLEGALEHSEEKLTNHVKIVIPSGEVVELENASSIADHFRRSFEREWPYANPNDADSAARYILANSAEHTVRVPAIVVKPARDPDTLWPLLLPREIGERVRFRYQPEGGGSEIDKELVVEGISHAAEPGDHTISFQCTEVPATDYWVLGLAGYTELDSTTRVGF